MKSNNVFVLDVGNTAVKVAHFSNGELTKINRMSREECESFDWQNNVLAIANVSNPEFNERLNIKRNQIIDINTSLKCGFKSAYHSMHTLGIDRFCNVEAMAMSEKKGNVLCIDIGTCLKFDFLDKSKIYLGGSISPGIDMRFNSLHNYTARLPLIEKKQFNRLSGKSTEESILSGVMLGIQGEILHRIAMYEDQYQDLIVFITGGDACYFDFHQKSNIFADENLTVKGIYSIYSRYAD